MHTPATQATHVVCKIHIAPRVECKPRRIGNF